MNLLALSSGCHAKTCINHPLLVELRRVRVRQVIFRGIYLHTDSTEG